MTMYISLILPVDSRVDSKTFPLLKLSLKDFRCHKVPLCAIIAGPDGYDTEVAPVPVDVVPQLALKDLRIAFAPTFPGLPVASEIRAAVEELAKQLTPLCADVSEATLPQMDFNQEQTRAGELIDMITGAFQRQDEAGPITLAHYLEALHLRDQSMLAWERFFEERDLLLCPPAMVTAFPHCTPGSPLLLDGRRVSYDLTAAYSSVFNYTGHPAVVLPYQRDHEGLPIGIQLVGKRWSESRLLAMAKALTEVIGAFQRPPADFQELEQNTVGWPLPQWVGKGHPLAHLFSLLCHVMVAKNHASSEAGSERYAPFYGEKLGHFVVSDQD